MCENTCATTHPAAQSFPPNSTSMDALVVGLAPKKGASKKKKKGNPNVIFNFRGSESD